MACSRTPGYIRKPEWLKIKLPDLTRSGNVISLLDRKCLNTICSSGLCPNRGECWSNGTATFMIGGDVCTRACRFCNVKTGNPHGKLDAGEIGRIVESIVELKLRHVVVTSVDRDDLSDLGASHWVKLIDSIHGECPGVTIEALIPDFQGREDLIDKVINSGPDVISHNMETVRRLTPVVRSAATYDRSLSVLRQISDAGVRAKSGLMLGLGETNDEVLEAMDNLVEVGCQVLTMGQYLQPTSSHYPVKRYVTPDEFRELGEIGKKKGFLFVESSPFVRSSYHAHNHVPGK